MIQGVQDMHGVPEKLFSQSLAAVIRVGEEFCDDWPTVLFSDDDGRGNVALGVRSHQGGRLDGPAKAHNAGYASPRGVAIIWLRGAIGIGTPLNTAELWKIIRF
jgi:hypothetical protein